MTFEVPENKGFDTNHRTEKWWHFLVSTWPADGLAPLAINARGTFQYLNIGYNTSYRKSS